MTCYWCIRKIWGYKRQNTCLFMAAGLDNSND